MFFISLLLSTAFASSQGDIDPRRQFSISDHFEDDHCEENFRVEPRTIINTQASLDNGANFLNETQLPSMARCLHYCCSIADCNAAVFDTRLGSREGGSCYTFDCGGSNGGELVCLFTTNGNFSSALLQIDRARFDESAAGAITGHQDRLEGLRGREGTGGGGPQRLMCGQYQFQCTSSAECIAEYDTCNGIPQCRDGSDEDPQLCPTTPAPTRHPHYRPDMDVPRQDTSVFRQRPNVQVPPPAVGQGGWGPRGQGLSGYNQGPGGGIGIYQGAGQGYPDAGMGMRAGFQAGYPSGLNPDLPFFRGQSLPDYGGYQMGGRDMGPAQYPTRQQFPPQQQSPLQYGQFPPGQQPQQFQPQATGSPSTEKPKSTTSSSSSAKPSPRTIATTTTTTLSPEEKYEAQLIKELGDELVPMSTPGMAVFTLSVGVILTIGLCGAIICRLHRGKMGFRRGLAHDSDGDYLVNGMYL